MIGESRQEYVFIRLCIFFLHWLAPFSICYCALALIDRPIRYRLPLLVERWLTAEALFYLLGYLPRNSYLQRPTYHPSLSRQEREELFSRCHETIPDPEGYIQKWFLNAPLSQIKRDNVKEFFAWAFLNKDGWNAEEDEELEEYVDRLEKLLGKTFEFGRSPVAPLRLTLDVVLMMHRSILWYLCVSVVDTLTYLHLLLHSFHFHRTRLSRFFALFPFRPISLFTRKTSPSRTLSYWHRPHTSTSRLPVLFIHGIGIGLYPYVNFLAELNHPPSSEEDGQIGIIAIEIMPISFRITNPAITQSEMCADILAILDAHNWPKCVLVTHSYGSIISTHLLRHVATASKIGPILFIDPVSFLLHLPDVAYNFTRRPPRRANEHQLYYFGSMDMGVAHTLARHFFWSENILWKRDIKDRRVSVMLSGKDLIVNTPAVARYLTQGQEARDASETDGEEDEWRKDRRWTGRGIEVLWFEKLDHAQVFDSKRDRRRLVNVVRAYCVMGKEGEGLNGGLVRRR